MLLKSRLAWLGVVYIIEGSIFQSATTHFHSWWWPLRHVSFGHSHLDYYHNYMLETRSDFIGLNVLLGPVTSIGSRLII